MNEALAFLLLILVAAFFLLAVVMGGFKPNRGRAHRGNNHHRSNNSAVPQLSRADIAARWATIEAMAGPAGGGNGLRGAIAEADKLLDHALRQSGIPGDTMGERLKAARSRFAQDRSTYDAVWRAHKLRNALAHEVGFDLVPSQAREAIQDFKRGLTVLGVL